MQKLPLSVSLISFNEEDNIARTLEAISDIAAEIVLVDSGSTDNTTKIAETFGAKVFIEDWKGFVKQKNSALQKCTEKWILALDCDEVVTPRLRKAIIEVVKRDEKVAYKLDRVTFYLGKKMKYAWRPDRKLRLVRRDCNPRWEGIDPHDKLVADCQIKNLGGDLLHYSFKDLKTHFLKTIHYSMLSAQNYFEIGKKPHFINLLLNPFFAFVKLYFLNLGVFDGVRGLIAAFSSALSAFLKYSFLQEYYLLKQNNDKQFQ